MTFTYLYRFLFDKHVSLISLMRISSLGVLRYPLRSLFTSVAILLASSSNAHAYIDPGYGSLLLQLLIAGLFGTLFYARGIIFKIKAWFIRKIRKE